jgi:hypothetical protein
MKTITIIITAVLALNVSLLQASNLNPTRPVTSPKSILFLAPVVPMEATFTDTLIEVDYSILAPEIPTEANFEDTIFVNDNMALLPGVPAEADFE